MWPTGRAERSKCGVPSSRMGRRMQGCVPYMAYGANGEGVRERWQAIRGREIA